MIFMELSGILVLMMSASNRIVDWYVLDVITDGEG